LKASIFVVVLQNLMVAPPLTQDFLHILLQNLSTILYMLLTKCIRHSKMLHLSQYQDTECEAITLILILALEPARVYTLSQSALSPSYKRPYAWTPNPVLHRQKCANAAICLPLYVDSSDTDSAAPC
jgi:hypothetical protein